MIERIKLERFKNFWEADFAMGPLTLLVGTNASGKSNLRDAFRFLHGLSRGYTVAEVIGEKWIEGGVLQWKGIRGGTRESTFLGESTFGLGVVVRIGMVAFVYSIEVDVGANGRAARVVRESLKRPWEAVFDSHPEDDPPVQEGPEYLFVRLQRGGRNRKLGMKLRCVSNQPAITQLAGSRETPEAVRELVKDVVDVLSSMRFLDLSPDAMRIPSLPGQEVLGDRGENLSSVLQAICLKEPTKEAVLEWIKELTPLDVKDFEFVQDQTGKILVSFVEAGGQRTSAHSASDGTLRFLAMIAALLGPQPSRFYFFEELENGIHPTRLHLLLQLIEQRVSTGAIQMVATSHSPQLLGFLSEEARKHALLVYRPQQEPDARIRRIMDIPGASKLIEDQDFARLHASGWLEDAVAFERGREETGS